MQHTELIDPEELDRRLSWTIGKAERLARQRRLPYILLPDGSIRFDWLQVEALLVRVRATPEVPA